MKKAVIVLVLILFAVGVVFAGGQTEGEPKEQSGTKEEKVSLSFSSWLNMEGASKKTIQEMIDRYQQKYPNVEVELIGIPFEQTQQQIFVAVSGGNAPDVMHLVAQWGPPLASMGTLEDLHDYYSDAELNDIPKAAYEAGLFQDQLATVPWQLGSIVVFAWKSVLEEAGLPTSSVPETWSEFKQQVAKISNLGDDTYGFGGRTSKSTNSAFWFFPVMWGHGGEFEDAEGNVVFNNPGTVEALQWYKELGEKEYTPCWDGGKRSEKYPGPRESRTYFRRAMDAGYLSEYNRYGRSSG